MVDLLLRPFFSLNSPKIDCLFSFKEFLLRNQVKYFINTHWKINDFLGMQNIITGYPSHFKIPLKTEQNISFCSSVLPYGTNCFVSFLIQQ